MLAGTAAADQTYNDSTGETANSADISTVAVSNNPTAGTITFAVTTNMPTMETNAEIDILVDSDSNASTGGNGFDHVFGLDTGGWFFATWNGSTFADDANVNDLQVTYVNGVLTITMAAADLGSPTAFNFAVVSFRGPDPNNPVTDQAPDSGVWTYQMTQPAPTPPPTPTPTPTPSPAKVVSVGASFAPAAPVHGKTFRVTGFTVDLSTGIETKATGLKCTATLGGKHLAGTGTGGCTFHLKATAKGKRLVVKVTGKYKTATVAKTYSFKVK